MNKPVLLLLLVLLIPVNALAIDLPFIGGGDNDTSEDAEKKEKEKSVFVVHFKNGGSIETDNYTVTKEHVIVMMESGAVYLDRKMVTSIEEVAGPERESIQTIQVEAPKPAPDKKNERPSPKTEIPLPEEIDTTPRDDEGHTEAWWQARVQTWKDKKAEAEQRYEEALSNWNRYDGQLKSLDPDAPDYERTRIQDLRGSARVSKNRARADIEEADNMLNNVLPEEARKAGALPGWVR